MKKKVQFKPVAKTLLEVKKVLKDITFAPSCLDMGWKWQAKETKEGFLIRTSFQRPDTNTGKIGRGFGRWMHIDKDISTDGLVKSAWLCAELIIKHELMECFLFRRVRIFDPHKSLEDLSYPKVLNKPNTRNVFDETGNVKGAKVFDKPPILGI